MEANEGYREPSTDYLALTRDIGPPIPEKDWSRRLECGKDLEQFALTYLSKQFYLPLCDDHRKVIRKADQAIMHGGLFAVAMPRKFGKTEITKAATFKAIVYGSRRFALMIGSSKPAAVELLDDGLKKFVESPEYFPLIERDFPEAAYPVLALRGSTRKQGGQKCCGVRTELDWGKHIIDFPVVPAGNWLDEKHEPASSSRSRIRATSIGGRLRGYNIGGDRPDLCIPDDVCRDATAISEHGNEKIEKLLGSAVVGLAGPDKKIAGIMPCTCIAPGDVIDRILNHELHPEYDSERTKQLYEFPTMIIERDGKRVDIAKEHWEKYRDILRDYNPNLGEKEKSKAATKATEYYIDNHEEMSAGAVVAWKHRCQPEEVDALQCAMNLYFQDKNAFFSECQNDPRPANLGEQEELTALQIAGKINGTDRYVVPVGATKLTAFIDVQERLLYYQIIAWDEQFTGSVIDYGTYPDQQREYFAYVDASHTFRKLKGLEEAGAEAQQYAALEQLADLILGRTYVGGGASHTVARCLIDSGYATKLVYSFCRQSKFKNILLPSKGAKIGPESNSITDHKKEPNETIGVEWYAKPSKESRGLRLVHFDANFWKSFLHARLQTPMGGPSCLSLFGTDVKDAQRTHRMISEHMLSEYRVRTRSDDIKRAGRIVDVWRAKPGGKDNHFFDTAVGCCVAASHEAITLPDVHEAIKQPNNGGARKSWAKDSKKKK